MLRVPNYPGVKYTVESSDDLSNWTSQDVLYGLGNAYVVPMREYTPPPPSSPPYNSLPPATNVSLRIQPASGTAGGSVVSWPSLDFNGPVIVKIAGEINSNWNGIPLFCNRFGAYNFFFSPPGTAVTPPAENPSLGPEDTAMLAVLEASVPDINLQIANSLIHSRNTPTPATPDPNSRRFWRVKVDASIDTDQDGSADWAEFEISARGTGMIVGGVNGNPFDADTNNDGITDGQQLDADLDGTADTSDQDASDNTATFPIGPTPRYALFPITNAPTGESDYPFQISDRGTVLYRNGTWTGGVWTALNSPEGDLGPPGCGARAINDHDVILGISALSISNTNLVGSMLGYCFWESPGANLSFVNTGTGDNQVYAADAQTLSYSSFWHHPVPGPILSNDGHFNAYTLAKKPGHPENGYEVIHPAYWKLPSAGAAATEQASDLAFITAKHLRSVGVAAIPCTVLIGRKILGTKMPPSRGPH